MENEYSVATSNKFNFFLDDDEPSEILDSLKESKTKKKDEKSKDAKADKSAAGKTDKAKGSKVLTPAQDQKQSETKTKTDDSKKDGQHRAGGQRDDLGSENRRPQSARENVPPRRQQQPRSDRPGPSGEHRQDGERRPYQGGDHQDRPHRGGFRERPPFRGDREGGDGFQRDRPPTDDRRFRGRRPPRRGDRTSFGGGEGRPPRDSGEHTEQPASRPEESDNRTNTASGERTDDTEGGRRPWPEAGDGRPEGGYGGGRGGRVFRRGGSGYRGRGRGFGGGRGGYDRFGKREFERHSGNDRFSVKPFEKRSGGGAHNWGKTDDEVPAGEEIAERTEERTDWAETMERAAGEEGDKGAEEVNGDAPKEEGMAAEEEDKEMTLAEYKALQEKQRARAQFNLRKPNEGRQDASWDKMVALKKEEQEHAEEAGSDGEHDTEDHDDDDRHGRGKKLNIQVTLPERHHEDRGPRGRGGRGGRGAPRGGSRGRGSYRGGDYGGASYGGGRGGYYDNRGSRREQAPKFDDNDFPALA